MRRNDAVGRPGFRRLAVRKAKPTVEGMEKRLLLATFTVSNTNDDLNMGSLRFAITQSNATPGSNIINFDIAASGVQTIALTSALPVISVPVVIDGTTERGFSSTPLVELNGAGAGSGTSGLNIAAGNSSVLGLAINRFSSVGIRLTTAGNNTIQNNFIGTNPVGTIAQANGLDGILVQAGSNNNIIDNNLISGNTGNGINLDGRAGGSATTTTTGNTITGNRIGVNNTGQALLSNVGAGIAVQNAPSTTIGGSSAAARNIISGNRNGIELFTNSSNSVVAGNYIGLDGGGGTALGNGVAGNGTGDGIVLRGITNVLIGGTSTGAGNVIAGNRSYAINTGAGASSAITIQANRIGTNGGGNIAIPNVLGGLNLTGTTNVTIGGAQAGLGNVISGNTGDAAIFGGGPGLTVQGNFIGTDFTGTGALGNGGIGVVVNAGGAIIGGLTPGAGNTIANNAVGVQVTTGTGTSILSNSIYNNRGLGIQLIGEANNSQQAPDLLTAESMGDTSTVTGTLNATVGTYTVQFFSTPNSGPIPAQGRILLGTATVEVTTTSNVFDVVLDSGFLPGNLITATATDAASNTSPFSPGIVGTGTGQGSLAPTISVIASATTVVAGNNVTYTFTITNLGSEPNAGVIFSNPIPVGTTFFSGSTTTGVPVVVTNGVANAAIGSIAAGQLVRVTITLTTGGGAVPSFTNEGSVTATTPTVAPGTITASSTTNVTASSDLAVSVVGPTDPVPVGQTITYFATINNNGPSPATGVNFSNILPSNVTFVSATTTAGGTPTELNGTVSAEVGTIAAGDVVLITIVVATNPSTPLLVADTATVTSAEDDPDSSNNTSTDETTIVPAVDLSVVTETVDPTAVVSGNPVTFTIVVRNDGPSTATSVIITNNFSPGLTFLSGTADGGAVTVANGVVTAPVGTLLSGATSTVTITTMTMAFGNLTATSVVSAAEGDTNPNNNTGTASVTASAQSDIAVIIQPLAAAVNVGENITYVATITNNGPSPATNVVFAIPLFAGAAFVDGSYVASPPDGLASPTVDNGVLTATISSLAAGVPTQVTFTVTATQIGSFTSIGTVSATEPDPTPGNNSATISTNVVLPSPTIAFAATVSTASENAGFATIVLTRTGGAGSEVSVRFSTVPGGNATPGLDYQPVSTIVTFPVGVTEVAVTIPVLANPFDAVDELVNLQIDSPTGGAVFAGGAAFVNAVLQIVNADPDRVGPTVTEVRLNGTINNISSIQVDTSGGLNPVTASFAANYTIIATGGGRGTLATGTVIPVGVASYNAATGSVLLIPVTALPANQLFTIVINGTGPLAVSDRAGNALNSVLGVTPGSNYALTFARGKRLTYLDENGTTVNLRLTGPGTLDINRTVNGQLGRLQVLGAGRRTVISGSVSPTRRRTTIGIILGLGRFGSVTTRLYTPPFRILNRAYPNPRSLVGPPAVDTLTASPVVASASVTRKTARRSLTAKAITTNVKHPRPALAALAARRAGR